MATVSNSTQQKKYAEFDEYIEFQLQKTRKSIKTTDILTALGGVAAALIGYLLLFVVLDHWAVEGGFGYGARVWMLVGLIGATVTWIIWKIVLPYRRSVTGLFAARAIEGSSPEFESNLLNLVDLKQASRPVTASIMTTMEKRAAVSLSHADVDQAVDRRPLMRVSYALLAVVVLMCVYTVFSPKKISPSIWRALFPTSDVNVATRTEFLDVKPGDAEVLARTQLEVVVDLRGEVPDKVTLFYTTNDHRFVDEPVELRQADEDIKRFQGLIVGENGNGVLQDMTYYIIAGDARTPDYSVTVIQPPSAEVLEIKYEYPPYMGLDFKQQNEPHIDAWEGTKIKIVAKANMRLETAVIKLSTTEDTSEKGPELLLDISNGINLSNSKRVWTLRFGDDGTFDRFYRIECKNERGHVTPEPTLYNIKIRRDLPPEVPVLLPRGDFEAAANAIIPLTIHAHDPDFLLTKLFLVIEHGGKRYEQTVFDGLQPSVRAQYDFDLSSLDAIPPKPGDKITYWIRAHDNKETTPGGKPNKPTTPKQQITIVDAVSEEEAKQDRDEREEQNKKELEEAQDDRNEDGVDQPDAQKDDTETTEQPELKNDEENNSDDTKSDKDSKKSDDENETKNADEKRVGEGQKESNKTNQNSKTGKKTEGKNDGDGKQKEKLSPDGADDSEVLKKLLDREKDKDSEKREPDSKEKKSLDLNENSKNNADDKTPKEDPKNNPDKDNKTPKENSNDKEKKDSTSENNKDEKPKNETNGGGRKDDKDAGNSKDTKDNEKKSAEPSGTDSKKDDANKDNETNGTSDDDKNKSPNNSAKSDKKKPGDGGSDKKDPKATDSKKKPDENSKTTDKDIEGKEEPTDDMGDAKEKKSDGDSKGKKSPSDDPNAKPNGSKKKSEGRKDSDKNKKSANHDGDSKSKKNDVPNESAKDDSKKKDDAKLKNSKKDPTKNPDSRPADRGKKKNSDNARSKRDDKQPNQGNDPMYGDPKEQKTKQSQGGESGQSKQNDKGSKSEKKGAGEDSKDSGNNKKSNAPKKDQSGSKGSNKKSDKDGEKSGGKSDSKKKSDDESKGGSGSGDSKSQADSKKSKSAPSSDGKTEGTGGIDETNQNGTPQSGTPDSNTSQGEGHGDAPADGEEANLEYKKKATNLVLKRLKEELERGEVDQELLDELGWNEDDMKKFVERIQDQLKAPSASDKSRESEARRRQFEEMLKSLNLGSKGSRRLDTGDGKRSTGGASIRRLPVPAEYREAFEIYTKNQAKRTKKPAKKSK